MVTKVYPPREQGTRVYPLFLAKIVFVKCFVRGTMHDRMAER